MIIDITPDGLIYVTLNQFKETYTVIGKAAKELTDNGTMEYDSLCDLLINTVSGLTFCDNCNTNLAHRNENMFRHQLCDVCNDHY